MLFPGTFVRLPLRLFHASVPDCVRYLVRSFRLQSLGRLPEFRVLPRHHEPEVFPDVPPQKGQHDLHRCFKQSSPPEAVIAPVLFQNPESAFDLDAPVHSPFHSFRGQEIAVRLLLFAEIFRVDLEYPSLSLLLKGLLAVFLVYASVARLHREESGLGGSRVARRGDLWRCFPI